MLNVAVRAARAAGAIINRAALDVDAVRVAQKQVNDFVSEVDQAAEEAIISTLLNAYPGHGILAEESGRARGAKNSQYVWIIDPLDGTTNFLHGFPVYAVSIALAVRGQVEHAVVYDPTRNDLFTATRGRGAFLNDRRIRVSRRTQLKDALVSTGFPFRPGDDFEGYMQLFAEVTRRTADVRRPGAASLDLAYVAAGYADGFFEQNLSIWDVAAGGLLVTEAGGLVGNYTGEADFLDRGECLAGNPRIYGQLVSVLTPYSRFAPGLVHPAPSAHSLRGADGDEAGDAADGAPATQASAPAAQDDFQPFPVLDDTLIDADIAAPHDDVLATAFARAALQHARQEGDAPGDDGPVTAQAQGPAVSDADADSGADSDAGAATGADGHAPLRIIDNAAPGKAPAARMDAARLAQVPVSFKPREQGHVQGPRQSGRSRDERHERRERDTRYERSERFDDRGARRDRPRFEDRPSRAGRSFEGGARDGGRSARGFGGERSFALRRDERGFGESRFGEGREGRREGRDAGRDAGRGAGGRGGFSAGKGFAPRAKPGGGFGGKSGGGNAGGKSGGFGGKPGAGRDGVRPYRPKGG